mgnify:CR=1 FL=1
MNADLIESLAHVADSSENVPHLRRLVVALAISGKLDASDDEESFTLMRERLKAERVRLIKMGKLKPQEELPSVSYEELPFEISNACHFERLGNLATLAKGLTGIQSAAPGPFPLVVTAEARSSCDHFDFDGTAAIVPMVSSAGHGKASINRLHYQEGKFALGNILCAVFPISEEILSARFLYEYLAAFKEDLLVMRMIGTANVSLTIGKIAEVPVPLVSRRIQQRVDELMTLCDRLEAAQTERESRRDRLALASLQRLNQPAEDTSAFREHARFYFNRLPCLTTRLEHIQQLRQTILNLAIRGQLVHQDHNDEPAFELLERVAVQKTKAGNAKTGRDWIGDIAKPVDEAFVIPKGWVWTRIANTVERVTVGYVGPMKDQYVQDGIPFLRSQNVRANRFREDGLISISPKFHQAISKSALAPGDVVVVRSGNVGTACVIPPSLLKANCSDLVVVKRPIAVHPAYLCFYLNSLASTHIEAGTVGVALTHFNTKSVATMPLPLPPLPEQHRIVARVDELIALCDRLEAQLTITQTESRRLLEAVLHEVLAGAAGETTGWHDISDASTVLGTGLL